MPSIYATGPSITTPLVITETQKKLHILQNQYIHRFTQNLLIYEKNVRFNIPSLEKFYFDKT